MHPRWVVLWYKNVEESQGWFVLQVGRGDRCRIDPRGCGIKCRIYPRWVVFWAYRGDNVE